MLQSLITQLHNIPLPIAILIVGLIYGCTNPLLTRFSKPTTTATTTTTINNNNAQAQQSTNALSTYTQILTSWIPFFIIFGINQLGSALNIVLLAVGDIKVVAPLTNTASFFITTLIESVFITRRKVTFNYILGLVFISIGIIIATQSR